MRMIPFSPPRPEVLSAPSTLRSVAPDSPSSVIAPSMPKQLQELLRDSSVLDVRLGHATLGERLPETIRFRFDGTGPLDERKIVPESDAAMQLLAGANGSAVADAIKGALHVLAARGQKVELTGLSMSRSTDDFFANLMLTDAEGRLRAGESVDADTLQQTQQELRQSGFDQAYGVYDGAGWMHLDPSTTKEFDELIAAGPNAPVRQGELIPTLQHELEHAVSPSSMDDYEKVPWLEEATAEVLTQWAGATAEMSQGMHLNQVSSGVIAYEPQVRELHRWLDRAGLDPKDPSQLDEAREMLQSHDLGEVPSVMAQAIVQSEGGGDARDLEKQIVSAFQEDRFASPGGRDKEGFVASPLLGLAARAR